MLQASIVAGWAAWPHSRSACRCWHVAATLSTTPRDTGKCQWAVMRLQMRWQLCENGWEGSSRKEAVDGSVEEKHVAVTAARARAIAAESSLPGSNYANVHDNGTKHSATRIRIMCRMILDSSCAARGWRPPRGSAALAVAPSAPTRGNSPECELGTSHSMYIPLYRAHSQSGPHMNGQNNAPDSRVVLHASGEH